MDFTPTPVFFLFIGLMIGLAIGWAIGYFDSNSRSQKKIQTVEANAEIKIKDAEKKIELAAETFKSQQDDSSLLHLKKNNGHFQLEMDGMLLNTGELSHDKRKRLIELISNIRPWLDGSVSTPPVAAERAQPQPVFVQTAIPTPSQPFFPGKHLDEKNIRSLSIVAQIDAVLQMHLMNTPFASQGISLTERTSNGGLEVHIGSQKYISLEDVPSQEIKAIIRAAIAEWEKKYMPLAKPASSTAGSTFTKPPPPAKPADGKEFKSLSIVAQIDTVLQTRLENSPLADKGIRLIERTALGGVEVYVGQEKYPSLEDVPDQEIKAVVRAAIEEWEKKYTPGM